MTAPLSQEERREIRHRADGAVTRRGQPSDDWAWMACMLAEDTLRLLADLERAETERDALKNKLNVDSRVFELECRKAQIESLEARLARVVEIASGYRSDEMPWEMEAKILAAAKEER